MAENKVNLPPLEISPLIKLTRWTCLIAGVIHGFVNRRKYAALEKVVRVQEEKDRVAREEYLALEKIRRNAADMRELEAIFLGTVSTGADECLNDSEIKCNNTVSETIAPTNEQ